jgi:hypothetical protein
MTAQKIIFLRFKEIINKNERKIKNLKKKKQKVVPHFTLRPSQVRTFLQWLKSAKLN